MFNKNKKKFYLGVFLSFLFGFGSLGYVHASTFAERLADIGMDINTFSNKNSISRYEVTRLLNAANCEDCIQAPDWMRRTYTKNFRDNFKLIDGKDFDDINYEGAVRNKNSYYYCVAYVGQNGYMAGYPSTSTKCKGSFCGQEMITTSEFYQTVLNIIQDQIRGKYPINWAKVKSWKKGLKKNSIQMKVLNQTNINAIDNADPKIGYAQTNDEFQAWLKYCMYNLSECSFQSFGAIGTGYWPVSELNILYKEGIITLEDAQKVATFPNMKGEEAIRIFSTVYNNYASCSFNVDYDCDGITNGDDNCAYIFNSNQYDLDNDGIGNVCDDDIDGDGSKNPIGIVDDDNHIVISLRKDGSDKTPLGNSELGFSFFINVDAISTGFPTSVRFSPLTNGNISKIERNFGDGSKQTVNNGNNVSHVFRKSGIFTIKAIATSKDGSQSFATNKIFIATPESENYALNIFPNIVLKNGAVEYTFSPLYSGNLDKIVRNVNDENEKSYKTNENFKATIEKDGKYVVTAKGYKNGELKAVAMFSMLQEGSPKFASTIIKPANLRESTSVASNLVGIIRDDIRNISINRGDKTTESTKLIQNYTYDEAGLKTIQHNVVLKDGRVLYNVATISVQNPLLKRSYAVNISGNRLSYNQNERMSLGLYMYPATPIISLFTSYDVGQKKFLFNPNLSTFLLDFSYPNAGDKLLTNSVEVNRCVALANQGTVHINSVDICVNAMKNGTLSQYKCDQDGDKIPDICDDDIDGDGSKNLIGIISHDNKDCSIGTGNINSETLKKQLGVCSLDNCPFIGNSNQSDLNNNGIGDMCETSMSDILSQNGDGSVIYVDRDQDGDGVPDSIDQCINTPGNGNDGCPQYYTQKCRVFSTCGDGKIDEGETCNNCPQDAGVCCGNGKVDIGETCTTCPSDVLECDKCGNGKIDEGEDCKNCPEDVGECTAYCGNGKVEEAEDCRNCEKDLKECSAICGNGEVEEGEDCKNCPEDVKGCKSQTCGDGKVDKGSGEECDNGENNGKDGKCTKMCTKYDSSKPKCGNGEIDEGEDCETCPVDLGEKCVKPDTEKKCGNGKIDEGEDCENCPIDVKDLCIDDGTTTDCGNGKLDEGEDCENCPQDAKDICIDDGTKCGNGKVDEGEDCENCPTDLGDICDEIPEIPENGWEIDTPSCNACPCEFVDFYADLTKGDVIRAKLWDKSLSVFYGYSNSVIVRNFSDNYIKE